MKYDDILKILGEIGPYQKRIFVLSSLPLISAAVQTMITLFLLDVPDHRCAIPGLDNDTYQSQGESQQALINFTLPVDSRDYDEVEHSSWGKAECRHYTNRTAHNFSPSIGSTNITESCHRWVYDKSRLESSLVSEQDLVCDRAILRSHAGMAYMSGLLMGSIVFGVISDRFGRKTAYMLALVIHCFATISISFVDSFVAFAILRSVIGLSCASLFTNSFVLAMEFLGPKYRAQFAILSQVFWAMGLYLLDLVAFLVRDWRKLELVLSGGTVLYLLLFWFLPESPRWQLSQGRVESAKKTIEKVARTSGKVLPVSAFEGMEVQAPQNSNVEGANKGHISQLLSSPRLLIRLLVVYINWVVASMVYYGLTLNVGSLGGSIYVNFAFSSTMELLANAATLFALPAFGRKRFFCSSMLLAALACLASVIPAVLSTNVDSWVTLLLSNVGKFGVTAAFSTIYVYTAELFPTAIRSSVLGSSSMVARLGGIAAPYIADLGTLVGGEHGIVLPFTVFGGSTLVAGFLSLLLPETREEGIPETYEDAINLGKRDRNKKTKIHVKRRPVDGDYTNTGFDKH